MKINKTKSLFFEKIIKINKTLGRLIKKKRKRAQINRIRNDREVTTNTTEIQRIIREYYKQFYTNKMDNLEEMNKFLEMYSFLRLKQEDIETISRPITSNEIKSGIKILPITKAKDQTASQFNSTKDLKKNFHFSFSNYSKILEAPHHSDTQTRQRYHKKITGQCH